MQDVPSLNCFYFLSFFFILNAKECIKDEGEVLLVVNQQGEGDKTLLEENGNGSGHI